MPIDYPGSDAFPVNVQIPADADPADGESVRLPLRQLADRTVHLYNQIFPSPGAVRTLTFHPSVFTWFEREGFGEQRLPRMSPLGGPVYVPGAGAVLSAPLNRMVPAGAQLQRVDLMVQMASPLPAGVELRLIRSSPNFDTSDVGTTTVLDFAMGPLVAGTHVITLNGFSPIPISSSFAYYITVTQLASSIGVHGLRVRFVDTTPRNY